MGSRRGRYAALVAALGAFALSIGCTAGAPPGFSSGDLWTIPLIGPLEDGLLLVPALVNDKGPFVFAIDPDAHVSIIDEDVLAETKALTGEGPRMLDENDRQQNRFYAEILSWQIGTLTVKGPKPAQIVGKGTFDAEGRRIHGVIGRDIIADSLVLRVNRNYGAIALSTQKGFKAPKDGVAIQYSALLSRLPNVDVQPVSRKLATATIGGQRFAMHLDLGAVTSQLRPRSWKKANLSESNASLSLVDEAGMKRNVGQQGKADVSVAIVPARGVSAQGVAFVPYVDKRWPDQEIEGTLGLGFFKTYDLTANWDQSTIYVTPRNEPMTSLSMRLARWQSKTLMSCANVGCVKITLTDPLAGKPAEEMPAQHPGVVVSLARDKSALQLNLEVLVAVTPAAGKPALDWLVANLPAGTERAMTHLPADYIGSTLTVIDAGLFPRACPTEGSCIDRVLPPLAINPDVVQTVGADQLKRVAGEQLIVPSDDERAAAAQTGEKIVGSFTVCLDATGKVAAVNIGRSTGSYAYDNRITRTIRETWQYEPYVINGKPSPVCTTVSFSFSAR